MPAIRSTLARWPPLGLDPHPDAELDLQASRHRVYDAAYDCDDTYDGSPWPPLSDADAAWARHVASDSAT
jgi:hypothetical protein